jgi:hypothetical protein
MAIIEGGAVVVEKGRSCLDIILIPFDVISKTCTVALRYVLCHRLSCGIGQYVCATSACRVE